MKIAYIVPSLINNSVNNIARMLAEMCVARGDFVKFFYFDDKFGVKLPCEAEKIDIKKPIDFDSFDIIHAHCYRPDKYLYKFRKQIKKAKTLCTVHCNLFDDLSYIYGKLIASVFTPIWKRYIASHDIAVQISSWLMHLYSKSMPKSRLIYNAVDVRFDEVPSHKPIEEKIMEYKERDLKVIGTYSFINRRKGIPQILRALEADKSLAFVCVGDGDERPNLEKLAVSLGVTDRCVFFDYQDRPYLLMRHADIFCCSSYSESFCLALFEAGTVGASVVCGKIPVFTELFFKDEVTFFELDNISSLVNSLNEAFNCKEEKAHLLKERIEHDFSKERMLSGYASVYESLLTSSVSMTEGGGYSYKLRLEVASSLYSFPYKTLSKKAKRVA